MSFVLNIKDHELVPGAGQHACSTLGRSTAEGIVKNGTALPIGLVRPSDIAR